MHGIIAWFARNEVAANLLMLGILMAGVNTLFKRIPTEVFPEFELDIITVSVPYRGSTPAEVEESVVVKIEEAIQDIEGIKQVTATAAEGAGSVNIEIEKGYDSRELLDDIKNRVDAINTFPSETEKPIINLALPKGEVITIMLAAQMSEQDLRKLGEQIRDEIASLPSITQVALQGVRPYEIAIEVSERTLQQYGLTLDGIARAIQATSIDLPAGAIKTEGGEILLRTKGQAYLGNDFENIVMLTRNDGTRLTLGNIAEIKDGFEETPLFARWNGKPCVMIAVSRVGKQNAIDLARTVKEYIAARKSSLPEGVDVDFWNDRSTIVIGRINTLISSALQGGTLVFLVLALFLRLSLALWVCIGIPVAFMGAIACMPQLGVSINIISLFGFILVLGIVVDDAIVTGENIFSHLQQGEDPTHAAVRGTQEVSIPVIFGVLTTVTAFIPIMMIDGIRGKIFAQIPLVVIPVLLFSLVESKLILPAHLKHLRIRNRNRNSLGPLTRFQRFFADGMKSFAHEIYRPVLRIAMRHRYMTLSTFIGVCIILLTLLTSNRLLFIFFPRVPNERLVARLTMPQGTPAEVTQQHIQRIREAAYQLKERHTEGSSQESVIQNIMDVTGASGMTGGRSRSASGQAHKGEVSMNITPPEKRLSPITSQALVMEWRKQIGPIPGARDLTFRAEIGRSSDPIDIQLTGPSFEDLQAAATEVKQRLTSYPDLFDIADTFENGKPELKMKIKPEAELLGLTMSDLATQLRQAFFGAEAQRIQRGREDVRVMVRYPIEERSSMAHLESMRMRTPDGQEIPFTAVADVAHGRSFANITRVDRNRTIQVTADADKKTANLPAIQENILKFMPEITNKYQGMHFSLEGEAREQRESFSSVWLGSIFVLFVVYALLAIPFRSYIQPVIVMSVIPFGLGGAIIGHIIMGHSLSIMSVLGMLALSGVVVNDSLVLVDFINRKRREGMDLNEAVNTAGVARFRAIMLTSITTFAGLIPIMWEKSTQAQFLIPMAISLGWGILFATFITLLLVPINYLLVEDARSGLRRYVTWQFGLKPTTKLPRDP
ncbi:MAG: efflux RND transporter permease subunit [Verrucomicrobiota bacterium]|nr:efflux RND transporter permease subunit [Verrucomicrobiota bacterium]